MSDGLGRYVRHAWRRPSVGPAYVRCGVCQKQVKADGMARDATPAQVAFVLRNLLGLHIVHEHPEEDRR